MGLSRAAKERRRIARQEAGRAAVCARKIPYRGKFAAEGVASRHRDCERCYEGYRLIAYRCDFDDRHWHVGHRWWFATT